MAKEEGRSRTSFRSMLEELLEEDREFRWNYEEERIKQALVEAFDRARKERRLTQEDLALYCRTTQSAISRFLNGQDPRSPRLDTLIKVADALGMVLEVELRNHPAEAEWIAPVHPISKKRRAMRSEAGRTNDRWGSWEEQEALESLLVSGT